MPEKLDIASPWVFFMREVESLFEYDDEISVVYDNDTPEIALMVENPIKAEALSSILGTSKEFGNVTLKIEVIPANDDVTQGQLIRQAFEGNPVLSEVLELEAHGGTDTYAMFVPEVAQFKSDNIASPYGISTMTYEQLARDVLDVDAFISSDVEE